MGKVSTRNEFDCSQSENLITSVSTPVEQSCTPNSRLILGSNKPKLPTPTNPLVELRGYSFKTALRSSLREEAMEAFCTEIVCSCLNGKESTVIVNVICLLCNKISLCYKKYWTTNESVKITLLVWRRASNPLWTIKITSALMSLVRYWLTICPYKYCFRFDAFVFKQFNKSEQQQTLAANSTIWTTNNNSSNSKRWKMSCTN